KSSLINCLRILEDVDNSKDFVYSADGSAPTGEVQTTQCTRSYRFPRTETTQSVYRPMRKNASDDYAFKYVVLWDLPGYGTSEHPFESYFQDKTLYAFDFATSSTLTESEEKIILKANEYNRPVIIVVTRQDISVGEKAKKRGLLSRHRKPTFEQYDSIVDETIHEAKNSLRDSLKLLPLQQCPPIFVISAHEYRTYMTEPKDAEVALLSMETINFIHYLIETTSDRRS
ncbi:unnamed protein product, partial [Didymodactylos carnosus]